MLKFEEDSHNKVLIVTVDGFIEKENVDFYLMHLKRLLNDWGTIKIVKIINNFEGVDFKSFIRVLKFYLHNLKRFEKCCLITHNILNGWQGFLGSFFAMMGHLISAPLVCQFKRFSFNKIDKARDWINEKPLQENQENNKNC